LDVFAASGDLPRARDGEGTAEVKRHGGVVPVMRMLSLSQQEAGAFALLLAALTGENLGTVAKWPAVYRRTDGGTGASSVALVEQRKPRRGPESEHRVAALEDLPASLSTMLEQASGDEPLFHSPLRDYGLVLELTGPAPEIQRRPVSHSRNTLRDHYLRRGETVREQSRRVVAEALEEQVVKARTAAEVTVLSPRLLSLATQDPDAAATEAGLAPEMLKSMA